MSDTPRLIEFAFPLRQASLDSVHEKNVRHGHISTLHIWPARRPLAACRAALIATLLPDPSSEPKPDGMSDEEWQKEVRRRRQELCEKIGGKVVKKIERKKMPGGQVVEREKEETVGGILHWGRERENAETLEWFRQEIRNAYGGRAPKVLDPFAGGGAIPLEAMRLGCEATAVDINPVAWFILKCTLEYPQKLAGQKRPLPDFILKNRQFMEKFFQAQGIKGAALRKHLAELDLAGKHETLQGVDFGDVSIEADLAWHVRAWGQWVLDRARRELARFYPVYADFEELEEGKPYERQTMRLVPAKEDGTADIESLNAGFSAEHLADKRNPRWIAKTTVAYLWARTVTCKNCRATIPLLKTRWLCKNGRKRVLLKMEAKPDKSSVLFSIEYNVPVSPGNAAQSREHDKRLGIGSMSRAGAKCPCCCTVVTMEDIRLEGRAGRLGTAAAAAVVDGPRGKQYRLLSDCEINLALEAANHVDRLFAATPGGPIHELLEPASTRSISCPLYGIDSFWKLFTPRQHFALGAFIEAINRLSRENKRSDDGWLEDVVRDYLCLALDRLVDYSNSLCSWHMGKEQMRNLFGRFSLPMVWDFCEGMPIGQRTGGFDGAIEWICLALTHLLHAAAVSPSSRAIQASATNLSVTGSVKYDLIMTDPPYYEAISYSDLSDVFYVVLRRVLSAPGFSETTTPKQGEVVQHIRADKNRNEEKNKYEMLMAQAFRESWKLLADNGRFIVVFAHKHPAAWEALVAAMIQEGFVVDGSWPIQTEMANRTRGLSAAALASSVWLVCKKRPKSAGAGWDNKVLEDMRANISLRLRDFWDAGIRGPDFVWAATGPALEAYSKHPVVKKADDPGQTMTVPEFLSHARRMVVDFVVGRVLSGVERDSSRSDFDERNEFRSTEMPVDRLDELTAYYLLHRHDFATDDAPVGACILYATACGLSDQALLRDWDLVLKTGGEQSTEDEEDEASDEEEASPDREGGESSGGKVKLKPWNQRRGRSMGYEAPNGRPVPLIDRIHCLMQLWKGGDVHKVDGYLDEHGLRRHELFRRVLQSLIELSRKEGRKDECALLESLSNHVGTKGAVRKAQPGLFDTVGHTSEDER